MIQRLHIQNYAIIGEMQVELSDGLNIITGETGAGKSILLGATGLILGERADAKARFDQDAKTIVEGVFRVSKDGLEEFFARHDLDFDEETIVRREINASGKSRAFINDTPVTLKTLQALSGQLVELHQQFDTLEMQEEQFQLSAIDALAGHRDLLEDYASAYRKFRETESHLVQKRLREAESMREQDFLRFQLDEFQKTGLLAGETEKLEKEQALLEHSEQITEVLSRAVNLVEEGEQPVGTVLRELLSQIRQVNSGVERFEQLGEELERITIDLEEWSRAAQKMENLLERDPNRLNEVQDRLDTIYQLMRKHQVNSDEELTEVHESIDRKLQSIDSLSDEIKELETTLSALKSALSEKAEKLSRNRKHIAARFEQEVLSILDELHMVNARIKVEIKESDRFLKTGKDHVRFLFSANKGGALNPIKKVASGGELSRLSLCIKSVVAGKMELPTLIFDEIDAGVSGEVAHKMGKIIQALARKHQIIMITHSPQIASKAQTHFFVRKDDRGDRTTAVIEKLGNDQKIQEIAKMLSGDPPTGAAIENAKELLHL